MKTIFLRRLPLFTVESVRIPEGLFVLKKKFLIWFDEEKV